jgi:hypothetical protein
MGTENKYVNIPSMKLWQQYKEHVRVAFGIFRMTYELRDVPVVKSSWVRNGRDPESIREQVLMILGSEQR